MAILGRHFCNPKEVLGNCWVLFWTSAPSRVALHRPRRSHDGAYFMLNGQFCAGPIYFHQTQPAPAPSSRHSHGPSRSRDKKGEADLRRQLEVTSGHAQDQASTKPWTDETCCAAGEFKE